jgi:arylsulfatase A-like enzyme
MAGTLASSSSPAVFGLKKTVPPNIIYIVCDQMRGDAMSGLGHPNARTPHLDRMARDGVCFRRCFSNNPVCVPSRISAFTGRYAHEHGFLSNHTGGLFPKQKGTLLSYLGEQDYRLAWVGKNHTFEAKAMHGVDTQHIRARESFRRYRKEVTPWWCDEMPWPEKECHGARNTDDGIKFLEGAKPDTPFFLHLSYFDPHPPYFAPGAYVRHFDPAAMRIPAYVPPARLNARLAAHQRAFYYDQMSDADLRAAMTHYHAAIEWGVDHQVGRLLDSLQRLGLEENTVVVFTADHGDFMGDFHMLRKGLFLYDALLHVPMIWYAPGRIPGGRQMDTPVQGVDLFPTFADWTNGDRPEGLSGISLRPQLEGRTQGDAERLVTASSTYADFPTDYFDAPAPFFDSKQEKPLHQRVLAGVKDDQYRTVSVRNRDWRFIISESRPGELYHLAGGVGEQENLYGQPDVAAMQARLEKEAKRRWRW